MTVLPSYLRWRKWSTVGSGKQGGNQRGGGEGGGGGSVALLLVVKARCQGLMRAGPPSWRPRPAHVQAGVLGCVGGWVGGSVVG
eukprot:3193215-Pleurochrysis_carterae.AAC.2